MINETSKCIGFYRLHFLTNYFVDASGNAVNLAARMEQTSQPDKIRVTKDFYEMVADVEDNDWEEFSTISVKNMGEVGTYLLKVL